MVVEGGGAMDEEGDAEMGDDTGMIDDEAEAESDAEMVDEAVDEGVADDSDGAADEGIADDSDWATDERIADDETEDKVVDFGLQPPPRFLCFLAAGVAVMVSIT